MNDQGVDVTRGAVDAPLAPRVLVGEVDRHCGSDSIAAVVQHERLTSSDRLGARRPYVAFRQVSTAVRPCAIAMSQPHPAGPEVQPPLLGRQRRGLPVHYAGTCRSMTLGRCSDRVGSGSVSTKTTGFQPPVVCRRTCGRPIRTLSSGVAAADGVRLAWIERRDDAVLDSEERCPGRRTNQTDADPRAV
jgi:hypothetical protein